MKKYKLIIWDLDGTIVDPAVGIIESVLYALEKLGIEKPNLEVLKTFVGPPLFESFRDMIGLDDTTTEKAVRYYRENFVCNGAMYEDKPYEGMKELIESIYEEGLCQIIATSKPTEFAKKIIRHNGMETYFTNIVGSNMDGSKASKYEVIEESLRGFQNLQKNEVVIIGDRRYEIEAAQRFGFDSIYVSYGYGTIEELRYSRPTHIADNVQQLIDLIL